MGRLRNGLVLLVLGALAATGAAEGPEAPKDLRELNVLTGSDALQGMFNLLKADKAGAERLIAAALPIAKEKKEGLTYNAALVLALVTAEMKDMAKSEAFFRVCMDKAAKMQSPRRILQSYGGLIELFEENKKLDSAVRVSRELLELKTDDGTPRLVMTVGSTEFGDIDFHEDDTFDPAKLVRPLVRKMLVQLITKQGKYDQALKLVNNLLKEKDQWKDRQLKGWVLREAGKYDEAAKVYEDVLERIPKDQTLDPEEKDYYAEIYRYSLSNIYVEMGRVDLATEQLQQLLARKPDDPGYHNDLGYIWADNGMKLDEAEKLIRRALELDRKKREASPKFDPATDHDNGAYLDSLGWVLFRQKKFEEAKKILQEAVKDDKSQHVEIFDHLGDTCLELGEKAEAVAAWRKGLEYVGESRRDQKIKVSVQKKIEANQ